VRKKPAALSEKCEPASTPLIAIGNEAVACGNGGFEMVVGRVRDQRFSVWIRSTDPGVEGAALKERARKVAEQVTGSLF
jgi:hypothetical protein